MPVSVRSFAKINVGLAIGAKRADGFHELRTMYQTLGIHDIVRVDTRAGVGIEIRSKDPRVPEDESNTCYRVADRLLRSLKQRSKIVISIEKNLPVQGGIGGGSSNAVATLFALERALKVSIPASEKLRIATEVGSDLPLFLLGGLVLGCGHGQEVYPLPDIPALPCVIVTPKIAVSTPQAFKKWDELMASEAEAGQPSGLTLPGESATITTFGRSAFEWLSGMTSSGVPAEGGDRAETLLLDLVRTGIVNDFERVVFPQHPELRDVKRLLEREGASYASLSGSGSTLYGFFRTTEAAQTAAEKLNREDFPAIATATLPRSAYHEQMFL
jgi:4-diphosphocytidyl-2-C-methyl-D-erythritol kinase